MSAKATRPADVSGRSTVRVLIVDDQLPFRRAAAVMVSHMEGFGVVGETGSGEHAVALADTLDVGLILMDVRLPGIDGVEATRRVLQARPDTVVMLVSTYRAEDLPGNLAACGAAGFLPKEELAPDRILALYEAFMDAQQRNYL